MPYLSPVDSGAVSLAPLNELLWEQPQAVKERERNTLLELLASHEGRCVLFGAGTLGKKSITLLREIGIKPLALTDSNPSR